MNLLIAHSLPTILRSPGMIAAFSEHEFLSFTDRQRLVEDLSLTGDTNFASCMSVTIPRSIRRTWTRQA